MPSDDTKERILSVAGKIFGKYGFQKTTIDDIARTAHKAKGSVYYYFNSKEELFRSVLQEEIAVIKSGLTQVIISNMEATGMLREFLLNRMALLKDAVNYHETLKASFTDQFDFLEDILDEFYNFEVELLRAILDKGVKEHRFDIADTGATANVIITAMKAIEIPFYLQNKITRYEKTIVELVDILIKGLEKS